VKNIEKAGGEASEANAPKPMSELARLGVGLGLLIWAIAGYGLSIILWVIFCLVALWSFSLPWYGTIPVLFLSFMFIGGSGCALWGCTTESIRDDLRKINPAKPKPLAGAIPVKEMLVAFCGASGFWVVAAASLYHIFTSPWKKSFIVLLLVSLAYFWIGWKLVAFSLKPTSSPNS
jgi:hypothetical protein